MSSSPGHPDQVTLRGNGSDGRARTFFEDGDYALYRDPACRKLQSRQFRNFLALPALARAAIKPNGQIDLAAVSGNAAFAGLDRPRLQSRAAALRGCGDYLIGTELIENEELVSKAA